MFVIDESLMSGRLVGSVRVRSLCDNNLQQCYVVISVCQLFFSFVRQSCKQSLVSGDYKYFSEKKHNMRTNNITLIIILYFDG